MTEKEAFEALMAITDQRIAPAIRRSIIRTVLREVKK